MDFALGVVIFPTLIAGTTLRWAAFVMPIQTLSPRRAGKIVETKLAIYSFVELQIQMFSKRHCKCRFAGGMKYHN